MTVRELREVLNHADPEEVVKICVNTPAGWVCPDGCAVDIKSALHGIDWHTFEILLVPLNQLDIHDVDEWSGKPKKEPKKTKSDNKKEPKINGLTIPEYIEVMEKAHEATKHSTLVFK